MNGKKYIVVEYRNDASHTAFAKAPGDVMKIASDMGFQDFNLEVYNPKSKLGPSLQRIRFYFRCLFNCFNIPRGSIFLVQHPMDYLFAGKYGIMLGLMFFKILVKLTHSKVIAIVHDLEDIRSWLVNGGVPEMSDTKRLNFVADKIIVHNEAMQKWLVEHNVSKSKLLVLQIFDYLADAYEPPIKLPMRKCVTIAGNMRLDKSAYIAQLKTITDVEWHLYGNYYDSSQCDGPNVKYHGVFPSEQLLSEMQNGFGIVWDGDSIDTCSGNTGSYLKVNNPHKLSMYIAAGLPIIIWEKSARADFVRNYGIGFTVSTLRNVGEILANVTEEQYEELRNNVLKLSHELRSGYFTRLALTNAIELL